MGTYGGAGLNPHGLAVLILWLLSPFIGVGFLTVPCAVASFLIDSGLIFTATGTQRSCLAVAALLCVALALLGPGAYSADARLFGRRVVQFGNKR